MAWLPPTSLTVEPARWDINCCAGGGIILSSVTTRYQLGLVFHAGVLTAPLRASNPQGTWEFAMNSAFSGATSPANDSANSVREEDAEATVPMEPEVGLRLPDRPSIAVLPFTNMSGDKEQDYFADGMV